MSTGRSSKRAAGRREAILNLLRERGAAIEITEIAESLGFHPNTVRFHLETLVDSGQVERTVADPARLGRPPQLFAAARVMDPTGPRNYRLLAEILVANLAASRQPGRQAIAAGREWGQRQAAALAKPNAAQGGRQDHAAAIDGLVQVLDSLDFAPELSSDGDAPAGIGLRHCPFLDIADHDRDIVCPVHLGLMRGVLESWGSTVTVDRLDAFVEPDLCMAHLTYPDAS